MRPLVGSSIRSQLLADQGVEAIADEASVHHPDILHLLVINSGFDAKRLRSVGLLLPKLPGNGV
jgi:hypothetical protein